MSYIKHLTILLPLSIVIYNIVSCTTPYTNSICLSWRQSHQEAWFLLQVPTAMLSALPWKFPYNGVTVYVVMSAPSATMPGWRHISAPNVNLSGCLTSILRSLRWSSERCWRHGSCFYIHIHIHIYMNRHSQRKVDETVKSTLQLLNAAAKEPSVKSVLIMSLAACALPTTGV